MPTYNWRCDHCQFKFEGFLYPSDLEYVKDCPMCGSADIHRMIEPPNVHFHHTDKEVRIPSPPKSVYIRRKT